MQIDSGKNLRVRGHFFSRFQKYDIVHDEILFRNLDEFPVADRLEWKRVVNLVQNVEFLVGAVLVQECDSRCKNDRENDARALDKAAGESGDDRRRQQDTDDRIFEFFKKEFPCRSPLRRGQGVDAVFRTACLHFRIVQPCIFALCFLCHDMKLTFPVWLSVIINRKK